MIKVLHVVSAVGGGGIERMLLNYYKYMDRNEVSFDIVAHKENSKLLENDFVSLGANVFYITAQRTSIRKNRKELRELLQNNKYDVIHFHHGFTSLGIGVARKYAPEAKLIVHSHNARKEKGIRKIIKFFLSKYVIKKADYYCACGVEAGESLFGKNLVKRGMVNIVNNAIETEKFDFSENFRQTIRSLYNIKDDDFVIGMVGRMTPPKNPIFILRLIAEIKKTIPNVKLLWVGDGELRERVENKIKEHKIENEVILAGQQKNANEFYNAFDLFILPSLYEGFPVVAIECQRNGCPVLLSNNVPKEAVIAKNCKRLPLDINVWTKEIENTQKNHNRQNNSEIIKENGYDIKAEVHKLTEYYKKIVSER